MDQDISLVEIVEEGETEAFSFMSAWNQTGYIDELDWNEALMVGAVALSWIALNVEFLVNTVYSDVGDAFVWFDGDKGAIFYLYLRESERLEESALSHVGFSYDADDHSLERFFSR